MELADFQDADAPLTFSNAKYTYLNAKGMLKND